MFYGVTLALVPPVKPELISPVSLDKTDISARSLCNTISSGAGASDWVIEFGLFLHILSW